jgi:hypothetical protein
MNKERRVGHGKHLELARLVGGRLSGELGAVTILVVGVKLIVIAGSLLPMGRVAALRQDTKCTA